MPLLSAPDSVISASKDEEQLFERLLASRAFENTPALRKLLAYLWERRGQEINEYSIATEALDRRPDFDPRTDAAVRVQVARLRQRLKAFYEVEGSAELSRIFIRHGAHELEIVREEPNEDSASFSAAPSASWPQRTALFLCRRDVVFTLAAIGLMAGGWAAGSGWRSTHSFSIHPENVPAGPWKEFLANHVPLQIVVPNPVFFIWSENTETLMVRDPAINNFADMKSSTELSRLADRLGKPLLAQDYTVGTDTRAAFRLAQFLQPNGVQVSLVNVSDISPEALEHDNLILLGTLGILSPFREYFDKLHFTIPDHKQYIIDTEPTHGVPVQYGTTHESATRTISPGIIGFLPGRTPSSHIIVLAGYYTSSLAAYITSSQGIADIQKLRANHGNCQFFGAIVLSEVDGINPLKSQIVDFKPYESSK